MGRPHAAPKELPEVEVLNHLFRYDSESGLLYWRNHTRNGRPDKIAGGINHGYWKVMISGLSYYSSRVIWKMINGSDPVFIDHINGDKSDNRLENLRNVDHIVNMKNKSLYVNNKSGFPGVEFHGRDGVWVAKIGAGNTQLHLGNFPTKDEAIACRIGAEVVLEYHQNHGRHKTIG